MTNGAAALALDTSTSLGSVAVGSGQRVLAELTVGVRAKHAESILPAIDHLLVSVGLEPSDLAAVVVGAGPGSFTGVRIAGATAKGLVRALGVPLYAYASLAAVAAGVAVGGRPACALFDARRGEVYGACYRFENRRPPETVLAPRAGPVAELIAEVGSAEPIFAGDGALRHAGHIEAAGGTVAPPHLCWPRATALLWLADRYPEWGRVPSPASWEPQYVRASSAERGV